MFIWRGWGLAVVGLTFLALVLTELGVERMFADDRYYQDHGWPKLLGLTFGAALVWVLSGYVDNRTARVVVDKATGEELTLRNSHDLFLVPLRYWPAILIVLGLGFLVFG
jgi:hypothetical protein